MTDSLTRRLSRGIIIADGAMGTLIFERSGAPFDRPVELLNLDNRDLVLGIHLDYINAGSDLIETNTFGVSSLYLSPVNLSEPVKSLSFKGAKIAREAREIAGREVLVAGSIGPLGRLLKPLGELEPEAARAIVREQAEELAAGGVDLICLETFSSLDEIALAIETVKGACDLAILAQMTFTEEGTTATGDTPETVARRLTESGSTAIGINCSLGPERSIDIARKLASASTLPVSVQPNAGYPSRVAGRLVYFSTPAYMAQAASEMIRAGCRIVGGCCGTTPEHIRALAELSESPTEVVEPAAAAPLRVRTGETAEPEAAVRLEPSTLEAKLGREFLVCVEIDPPKGYNPEKALAGARRLKEAGIDAVNIADSPMARVRMSGQAMGYLIKQEVGLEVILHLTTRDHSLLGLQAELLGAHAIGIHNILAVTGDPPSLGPLRSTGVFDIDSIGLVRIINRMNSGTDSEGNPIGQPSRFLVGVGVNPAAEDLDGEIERFREKIDSGARFAMTQPIYDLDLWRLFLDKVGDLSIPILFGVLPLESFRHAEFLHNEVPGITIPQEIRQRLKEAGERAGEEGIKAARELIDSIAATTVGIYLMPSFGRYENVLLAAETVLKERPQIY